MTALPVPPADTPVNETGQALMSIGVAIGLVVVVCVAVRLSRRWSTWTPTLIPLSTLIAACMMPMPDAIANMWYFSPGQVTLWTTYGVSLPVWTFFSYVAFYGGFGLAFCWLTERGATRRMIVRAMGAMWIVALVTEIAGTQLDTYTYYGPQPLRVAGFPIWVSLYNVAICASIGVCFVRLRRWLPTRELIAPALFLAPALVAVGLVGTSFPVLQVTHTPDPETWKLYLAAIASVTLSGTMAYFATRFVPIEGLSPIGDRVTALVDEANPPHPTSSAASSPAATSPTRR